MNSSVTKADVVVVGGGIIGRSVALSAARRGLSVVVVEPAGRTFGTSSANAGHLVPSHVVPFASPGMVRAGLRSLMVRDGAFAVAPRAVAGLVPWLWRFARSSTRANVERGVPALHFLLDATVGEVSRLHDAGFGLDHRSGGILQVCTSAAGLGSVRHEADGWARWGVRTEHLDAAAVRAVEPMSSERVVGAVRLVDDARIDPALLLAAVTEDGHRHGAETYVARVARIEPRGDRAARVHTSVGVLDAGRVVVAAGVWSRALCLPLGVRLPIVPARGNSITLAAAPKPNGPMLLVDQRLALSPLGCGLRITGGFRLTRPDDREIVLKRSRELVQRARVALDLPAATERADDWTGLRPATPDGLPIIGALPGQPAVLVAAGHGMLGSSTGLGTGEIVAALLLGEATPFDQSVVSPGRFTRKGSSR